MIPIEIRATRFRSFKKETRFRFPKGPGLFFMWGDNQAEPRLEGNAAGKSSIWDALLWCIYGKTSRGLKAGDAANWDEGKGSRVEYDFEVEEGAGVMTLVRTWSPNSFYLLDVMGDKHDLSKDETNLLASFMPLDYSAFLQSVIIAQAQPMFLDLKAEAKASLFSEVMGLDRWLDLSQKASKAAARQDEISRGLEKDLAHLEGELHQLENSELHRKAEQWEMQRRTKIREIEQDHASKCLTFEDARKKLVEAEEEEILARRLQLVAADELQQLDDQIRDYRRHQETCRSCGQAIDTTPLKLINDREAQQVKVQELKLELRDCMSRVNDRRQQRDYINRALDDLEDQAEHLSSEKNPFEEMIRSLEQNIMHAEDAIYDLRQELAESEATYSLKSSWVRWFKEIRLGLISEALTQLEIEVNSCLNALGLLNWELQFEVDRETAKGSITRGFSVFVVSPHNPRPVPWEAWSGGESQRLRIAAQQGLGNLVRARTGTSLPLEIWDEPTQFLSGRGVTDLLDSLAERAVAEGRQIWVVDHRSLGYGNFTGSVGVIKTEAGSSFDATGLYISGYGSPDPEEASDRPVHDGERKRTRTRLS